MSARSTSSRTTVAVALLGLTVAWNAGNVGPVADEIADDFGLSLGAVGLLSGTFFLGATVLGLLIAATVGEHTGVVRGVRLCCALAVVGNLLFAVVPLFVGLALGRVLGGLALAFGNTLGAVWAKQAGGVRLLGIFGGSIQLGIALALLIGSALSDLGVGWRIGFVLSAALGVVAYLSVPDETDATFGRAGRSGFLRSTVRDARLYRLALLFVAMYGVPMILSAWLVVYLADGGLAKSAAGTASFLLFGLSAVGRVGGARLAQRGVPPAVLTGSLGLAAVGLAGLTLDRPTSVVFGSVALAAAGFGIPYALALNDAQQLYPDEPSEPVALMTLVAMVPPIVAIPFVGRALDSGDAGLPFGTLAVFVALAAVANVRRPGVPLADAGRHPA